MNKYFKTGMLLAILLSFSLVQCKNNQEDLEKKANEIHKNIFTLDSHCDTPLHLMEKDFNIGKENDPRKDGGKVDFVRMKKGGLNASFFAVFLGQGELTNKGFTSAKKRALKIFNLIFDSVKKHSDMAEIALTPDDGYKLKKKGKLAIYIGMENGYPIGKDIKNIEEFYNLGARYITLCHSSNSQICDSSTDKDGEKWGGLSPFGKKVVKEMNRLGMMIDVSHVSDKTFYNVIKLSKAPVIASHSCSREISNHPRNMTDDMIKTLAKNDGVIQLCILGEYVKRSQENKEREKELQALMEKYKNYVSLSAEKKKIARKEWMALRKKYPTPERTVAQAVDHIDHIVKIAGIDHIGIGTDFDGGGGLKDCYDVSEIINITKELVRRGYSKKDIEKIWGGNFMRVFRKVQAVAKQINSDNS